MGAELGKGALPSPMLRDFLQMMGNAFPVYSVVERNTKGSVSARCQLCGKGDETYAHMQGHCEELMGIRQQAHDDIVETIMHELEQRLGRAVQDQRLAEYEPDTIILWTGSQNQLHSVVVEFTLSILEDADTHHRKIAENDGG
eukprot:1098591-Rhodomonas_salina.1